MNIELLKDLKKITDEERRILDGNTEIDRELYSSIATEDMYIIDSSKLLDAGKLISIRPNTRFVHFPKHKHNYIEVMYMCSGSTRHLINDTEVLLKEGELLFLSKDATQEIMPCGEGDIGVNFIILPEFFNLALVMMEAEESLLKSFVIDSLTGKNEAVSYLHFKVSHLLPIQNLVENLIWTLLHHQNNKRSVNEITMGLLLLQLIGHTEVVRTDSSVRGRGQHLMIEVLRYVESNYRDASLKELSELLHYDIAFLSKEIKKYSGQNFTDLLKSKRLSQAQYLLRHTKSTVSDISLAVGYENVSYFHREFQKKFNMSPRKYRISSE